MTLNAELLLTEVRRNQRYFTTLLFWRDVREVGTALFLLPLWIYLGVTLSLPWTWYLSVPALLWVAGYMLVDRLGHDRKRPGPGESLRQHAQSSLSQVEHQIWLLGHVLWWYLLPIALAVLAFFGQVAWTLRSGGWPMALILAGLLAIASLILAWVYQLNQDAIRTELEPRRQELEALVRSLADESATPGA
jgi:hypothetical protein